jgi:hypothetical protein
MNRVPDKQLFDGAAVVEFRSEHDRRSFLRNALLVGVGATYVASVAGDPRSFLASSDAAGVGSRSGPATNDLDILNYALTLEYLEAGFYELGIAANLLEAQAEVPAQHVQGPRYVPGHRVGVRGARRKGLPRAGAADRER